MHSVVVWRRWSSARTRSEAVELGARHAARATTPLSSMKRPADVHIHGRIGRVHVSWDEVEVRAKVGDQRHVLRERKKTRGKLVLQHSGRRAMPASRRRRGAALCARQLCGPLSLAEAS